MALVRQCDTCKKAFTDGLIEGVGTVSVGKTYSNLKFEIKAIETDNGIDGREKTRTIHPDMCRECLGAYLTAKKEVATR